MHRDYVTSFLCVKCVTIKEVMQKYDFFRFTAELFRMFEPLWGPKSLPYAVGDDGKRRRQHYDKALDHDAVRKYFPKIQQVMCMRKVTSM